MKKEILFTALTLAVLITTSCSKNDEVTPPEPPAEIFNVWDGTEATTFAAGTGTQSDPYQIETGAQIALLHKTVLSNSLTEASYFKLIANVDMADIPFSPIGSKQNDALETVVFKGTVDGDGKTIKGVKLDETKSRFTALFSYLDATAVVKNLHVEGDIKNDTPQPSPSKGIFTGGIAAVNSGKIIDCTFSGNIVHTQPWGVGGIAGTNSNLVMGCGYIGAEGKKIYCPDSTNPSIGVGIMGGIVGMHNAYDVNAYVIACYNTGSMESAAEGRMGGIVGEAFGDVPTNPSHAVVVGCYNRGAMVSRAGIGSGDMGGIAAYAAWGHTMVACYSTATITNPNGKTEVGGIMGSCDSSNELLPSTATSCYWLDTTNDNASSNGLGSVVKDCVSKTAAQLKSAEVITSLNEAIAEYNESASEQCPYKYVAGGDGYPVLEKVIL